MLPPLPDINLTDVNALVADLVTIQRPESWAVEFKAVIIKDIQATANPEALVESKIRANSPKAAHFE
jgi:hypothetical protein